jgi:hypothetical protein
VRDEILPLSCTPAHFPPVRSVATSCWRQHSWLALDWALAYTFDGSG